MFFVAYFIGARTYIVIPKQWIKDCEIVVQKFMNKAINQNQKILCYFANGINDEAELLNHRPNFDADRKNQFPFDGIDGCFYAQMRKYFCK